jgi:peptide/nickel transport system permease protein
VARFALRRLLGMIPLMLGVSVIIFGILQAIPGGPLAVYADNPHMRLEDIETLKRQMGLDQPIPIQYLRWLQGFVTGNWGFSFSSGRPVIEVIAERFPYSIKLMAASFIFAACVALPLGIISAVKKYSIFDYSATTLAFFGISMPVFWFGLMLQLLLAVKLGWLPVAGAGKVGDAATFLNSLPYLIMPTLVLSLFTVARWSRYVRSGTLEVLNQDYIRTARSKGMVESRVVMKHALKNALIPVITVMAVDLAGLVSGAVVTETIFAWPGMGSLMIQSVRAVDYPVLMGLMLSTSFAVIFANFLADLTYGVLDPRIRYE